MIFEYYDNYLKVTNYRQLKQLEDVKITIDNLIIIGKDLMILSIDKDEIVIKGLIKNLTLGE